jgi:DNA-binding transcriptional regulator LsrR (DeoR family)
MGRTMPSPANDEGERFLARVAWAYHVEGLTQGAVAERLGVTRLRVNKALAEARRLGLVRIALDTRFAPCVEAEAALKARYGLAEAFIAPGPADPEETRAVVGMALGHQLTRVLADPAVKRFGMSWGNTLNVATRHVGPMERPDLEIVSVLPTCAGPPTASSPLRFTRARGNRATSSWARTSSPKCWRRSARWTLSPWPSATSRTARC